MPQVLGDLGESHSRRIRDRGAFHQPAGRRLGESLIGAGQHDDHPQHGRVLLYPNHLRHQTLHLFAQGRMIGTGVRD
jgi:hypothetical protein